jgi:putative transposase
MIWKPKKLTREQMAERRKEGVRLLEQGKQSQAEIARNLGVSEAAVSVWQKKLRKHGKGSLAQQKATGRPASLTTTKKAKLVKILKAGALASGFETERWTQARVQQVLEKKFGVHYHQNYISRLLHDMGWSVQKPETRAKERDEELIRAWLSRDWPRIKKSAASRRGDHL